MTANQFRKSPFNSAPAGRTENYYPSVLAALWMRQYIKSRIKIVFDDTKGRDPRL